MKRKTFSHRLVLYAKLKEERGYHGDGVKGHPEQTHEMLETGTVVTEKSYKLYCTPINREELEAQISLLFSGETNHLNPPALTEKENSSY